MSRALLRSLKFKIFTGIALVLLLFFVGLLSFKRNLSHYAIVRYLNSKGISIDFTVQTLNLQELHLTDIVLQDKIHIPHVRLLFNSREIAIKSLQEVDIEIASLDIPTLQDILAKLKDKNASSEKIPFSTLRDSCFQAQGVKIHMLSKSPHFELTHAAGEKEFLFQSENSVDKNSSYKASGRVACGDNKVSLQVQLNAEVEEEKKKFIGGWENLQADIVPAPNDTIAVRYQLSDLYLKKSASQTLMQGVSSVGEVQLQGDDYFIKADVTDRSKTLAFKDIEMSYQSVQEKAEIRFKKNSSMVRLSPKINELFPILAGQIQSAEGRVLLSGAMHLDKGQAQGRILIQGRNISLVSSAYGQVQNLRFDHDVLSSQLNSSQGRSLSLERYEAGAILSNITVRYQVHSPELVRVDRLKVQYEGAQVDAGVFIVRPQEPSVSGFRGQVTGFPLETLLKLGLKDAVNASGALAGNIDFALKNKIPVLHGRLTAVAPGWIKYRTGAAQQKAIQLSDGPVDILNGYLYDFSYETLSVDIKTNAQYKNTMTLSTLGRNPSYLKGKPLKLKITLEQNLLAAVQSLMLTYDLPEKIKEHFEKSEDE